MKQDVIPPGSVIGILGDGQLGRMIILGGAPLGYGFVTLGDGGRMSPAGQVASAAFQWRSSGALDAFLSTKPAVVMIEWENVPLDIVRAIEHSGVSVRPSSNILAIAQDRLEEKAYAASIGIATVPFRTISTTDIMPVHMGYPTILKTRRGGYDGKGQIHLSKGDSVCEAWMELGRVPCILEEEIDLDFEVSVIITRQPTRNSAYYGPFRNKNEKGILRSSQYPAGVPEELADLAVVRASKLADALDVHGILAVEYFVDKEGQLIFNEMAPRPHNSGHLTIDACYASQFEQYLRAVCNLPWGSGAFHSHGIMRNILGGDPPLKNLGMGDGIVHWYGKREERNGRKMGHRTDLHPIPKR